MFQPAAGIRGARGALGPRLTTNTGPLQAQNLRQGGSAGPLGHSLPARWAGRWSTERFGRDANPEGSDGCSRRRCKGAVAPGSPAGRTSLGSTGPGRSTRIFVRPAPRLFRLSEPNGAMAPALAAPLVARRGGLTTLRGRTAGFGRGEGDLPAQTPPRRGNRQTSAGRAWRVCAPRGRSRHGRRPPVQSATMARRSSNDLGKLLMRINRTLAQVRKTTTFVRKGRRAAEIGTYWPTRNKAKLRPSTPWTIGCAIEHGGRGGGERGQNIPQGGEGTYGWPG